MGRAVAAAAMGSGSVADRVRAEFRERIGEERFAVWFGESSWRDAETGPGIVIRAGSGVTHEWLRRTFRVEVEEAAVRVSGREATVAWEPAEADSSAGGAEAAAEHGRRAKPLAVVVPTVEPPAPAVRRSGRSLADFVVGPSNRMAFAAVELAASRPGEMSPLVIHGPSGVGKTHLLEGICGRFRESHPSACAVYLAAEQFTTGFLQGLHGGGLPGFRRSCRSAELLVVDDLQFFVGKRATIQELQQTIDHFLRQGRQVVLGCDREPEALGELGPELLARLRGGMTARLLPPDYDVRREIVAALCRSRRLDVPDEVVHYVASHMTRHARELYGAVNRLEATSTMLGVPLDLGVAEESLADLVRAGDRGVRLADIEQAVCQAFGIDRGGLQSGSRARAVSHGRMLAMYLARKHTHAALTEISGFFGRRSHSTVVAAQKTVAEWLETRARIVLAEKAWDAAEAIRRVEEILRAG
ncbi:MAG: chromosomal replication initiator DnaA [Planctomycetes bacterium]|nr:chromosomal replication initiator DnaA [Planctomycetota bacterium]